MDKAFVEHSQNDVHGDQCCQDQQRGTGERSFENLGGALETSLHIGGDMKFIDSSLNRFGCLAQRRSGGKVERKRNGGELALMVDRQKRVAGLEFCHGRKRNQPAVVGLNKDFVERLRVHQIAWVGFEDDIVLVEAFVQS